MPDLKLTLEKYLRCVMPIVSEEAYQITERLVNEFGATGGVGERLQAILLDIAEKKENWVSLPS